MLEGVDFSLAEFLGGDGRWRKDVGIAGMTEQQGNWCSSNKEAEVRLAESSDEQNSGLPLPLPPPRQTPSLLQG